MTPRRTLHASRRSPNAERRRYTYDAFGLPTILAPDDTVRLTSAIGNRFLFTGREWDATPELYSYRARYYEPWIGRFYARDPFPGVVALPGTLHPYMYVLNNPVNFIDPSGLDAEEILVITEDGVPHTVLVIDDPNSPTGKRYFDFFPAAGYSRAKLAVGLSTPGVIRESARLDPSNKKVIGVTRWRKQSVVEDRQMLQEVRDTKNNSPKYNFYRNNCLTFTGRFIE